MSIKRSSFSLVAALGVFAMLAAACGGSLGTSAKGKITVGGFKFPESSILAQLYGQALAHAGYQVSYKLNSHIDSQGLVALTASPAADQNAFAVTKATQQKFNLTKLSDLAPIGNQLVLGAGPECPTRPFCLPGLQQTYAIHFKAFKPLDTDGPATRAAFKNNTIQVGLVFSSDADLNSLGLVVLDDDKHLQAADQVVPILRKAVANDEVKSILNKVSAGLSTTDLVGLNAKVSLEHQDPDAVAKAYLEQHNYFS